MQVRTRKIGRVMTCTTPMEIDGQLMSLVTRCYKLPEHSIVDENGETIHTQMFTFPSNYWSQAMAARIHKLFVRSLIPTT